MKPLSDFYTRIQPHAALVPLPTLDRALVDAAITFCEDSRAIRQRLDPFDTVPTVAGYELDANPQQQVAHVLKVWFDGIELTPLTDSFGPAPNDTEPGTPQAYWTSRADSQFVLNLWPAPDRIGTVVVNAAMRPVREATQLEDDLLDLWADALTAGALGRVLSIPGQSWTDVVAAAGAQTAFMAHAQRAKVRSEFGRQVASMRVRPRKF